MLRSEERETEILLGNKQLLGIFFVIAALLGIAFTGGYAVGHGGFGNSGRNNTASTSSSPVSSETSNGSANAASAAHGNGGVGETHSVSPEDGAALATAQDEPAPLGSRATKKKVATAVKTETFNPEAGQQFLQVTAVPHAHAVAVAAVLRKKGFSAHAVPKPGEGNLYRVLIGPIRNAGELSSTRDSLRKTGFNQVLVQRYQ